MIRFGLGAVKGVGAHGGRGDPRGARERTGAFDVAVRAVPARRHPEVQPPRARAADQERRARRLAGRPSPRAAARGARRARSSAAPPSSAIAAAARPRCSACSSRAEPPGRDRRAAAGRDLSRARGVGRTSSCSRSRRRRSASTSRATRSIAIAATSRATRPRRRATSRPARKTPGEHSIGGIVSQYREMITKKGDKMARFMLEDAEGTLEVIAFPKTFEKVRHVLVSDEPILCTGQVKNEGTRRGARVEDAARDRGAAVGAAPAEDARASTSTSTPTRSPHDQIDELKTILANATRGGCQAVLRLKIAQRSRDRDRAARRVGGRRRPTIC